MDISSSAKRIAVRLSTRLCKPAVALTMFACAGLAHGQTLFDSMRERGPGQAAGGYVFVSSKMSDTTLIALARDARGAGLTMVLNGFWGDLDSTRRRVGEINRACCGQRGAAWQINPLLFQRYRITAVPAFVIAVGPGDAAGDFSKVAGEMSVANALKFFGQRSALADVRKYASKAYVAAFATQ